MPTVNVTARDQAGNAATASCAYAVGSRLLIGARHRGPTSQTAAELGQVFLEADAAIGPLHQNRVFSTALPATFSDAENGGKPVLTVASYKARNSASTLTYARSVPAARSLLTFYHEPEGPNGWPSGADYVAAYTAEYDRTKAAAPGVQFGMISGGYQWRANGSARNGSYLPPASKADWYGFDTYRDGLVDATVSPNSYSAIVPLSRVDEFQTWYAAVKDRGRPLYVTEYGRGIITNVATRPWVSGQRAEVIAQDEAWLREHGFKGWLYWWTNTGTREWKFQDQASIDAWRRVAARNDVLMPRSSL